MKKLCLLLFALILQSSVCFCSDLVDLEKEGKLNIKLIEPVYKDGMLTTDKGGTISGKDFTLQATHIQYIRKTEKQEAIHKIYAWGNLAFHYSGKDYVGEKLEFNVDKKTTIITNGCTYVEPWYAGGTTINLAPDGSGLIQDAYITTAENEKHEWEIFSKNAKISKDGTMRAKNVSCHFVKIPFFWIPSYTTNLKKGHASPIKYRLRWGGGLNFRLGLMYSLYHRENVTADLLGDIVFGQGIGAGVIVRYDNPNGKEKFVSYNYGAHDITTKTEDNPWLRYRFRGEYSNSYFDDWFYLNGSYDKLSDSNMRSDYMNQGLDSSKILPTEVRLSKNSANWVSNINTKVRINEFQTIKEELPLFQWNGRPMQLGRSHLLLYNNFSAGWLNYKFADFVPNVSNFHSSRIELAQGLQRHFQMGPISITPEVGYDFISYNNSPRKQSENLAVGIAKVECHTRFVRPFKQGHDFLEPYVQYDYVTHPTSRPQNHFLFDMRDGWYRLNSMRFGFRNFLSLYSTDSFSKQLTFDLYSRAFFRTPTMGQSVPKIYLDATWKPTPYQAWSCSTAYDTYHKVLDHFNIKSAFTLTDDIAFTVEYRKRSAFDWRKTDRDNFMLETWKSNRSLADSPLSDRRDTVLGSLFFRLTPTLSCELLAQHGFHRIYAKPYNAFELDISTLIRSAMKATFSIQTRNNHRRYSLELEWALDIPKFSQGPKIGQSTYAN